MRLVLGLSLTASSAVWVLVDTDDGRILAEEVVELESLHEIARAAALSVQAFDSHTEHDIETVRLTWTDDAHQQGVRLRTKLRLFGFEPVETVSADAARAGRNKTARHLAPHLALAYGAARADCSPDEGGTVLQRFSARVPVRAAAVSGAAAALVLGGGLFAFEESPPPATPQSTAAEAAGTRSESLAVPAPTAAPPKPTIPWAAAKPAAAPTPSRTPEPIAESLPATTAAEPEYVATPEVVTEVELDSTVPVTLPATTGVPHLSGSATQAINPAPAVGSAEAGATVHGGTPTDASTVVHGATPLQGVGPAPQATFPVQQQVAPAPANVPSPLPPPLSRVFGALP
ncbi:MAG: hypothetical protein AB7G47_04465 [Mycolicibacterium sp.]|uniref:hypothetical protein n=1 Tax=Mycolicibacterium sp. TaxID=2320850 RepID=UPI003D0AE0AF